MKPISPASGSTGETADPHSGGTRKAHTSRPSGSATIMLHCMQDALTPTLPVEPWQVARLDQEARAELMRCMSRRVEYEGHPRPQRVVYREGEWRMAFDIELGLRGVAVRVDVPRRASWSARTGSPLARRAEILQFVAACVQRRHAPHSVWVITDDSITYLPAEAA